MSSPCSSCYTNFMPNIRYKIESGGVSSKTIGASFYSVYRKMTSRSLYALNSLNGKNTDKTLMQDTTPPPNRSVQPYVSF